MRAEIIAEIEALEVHYFRVRREPEERQRWLRDYLADLGDVEVERLRAACQKWRMSPARKFPTSGELMQLAPGRVGAGPRLEAWRPLSDYEYDRLPLREKIRHQRILAEAAAQKAGPQMINKRPALADDMPAHWHEWRQKAANHTDEVRRLSEKLAEAKARNEVLEDVF